MGTASSAAQNGQLIQTSKNCGAVYPERAQSCLYCGLALSSEEETSADAPAIAPTEGNLAVQPDWRREVTRRLKAYRARRGRPIPDDSQPDLPFSGAAVDAAPPRPDSLGSGGVSRQWGARSESGPIFSPGARKAAAQGQRPRANRVERVEIDVHQPELDFSGAKAQRRGPSAIFPLAEMSRRRNAGTFDAVFLLLAYAVFLALFKSLSGQFALGKYPMLVYGAVLALFYAHYFAWFTLFGAATPGMLLCGLHLVSFDGTPPTLRQLLWRSFGYVVSGGTVLLGFLWALWDEDHLTWQDRFSQTYLTRAGESHQGESAQHRAATGATAGRARASELSGPDALLSGAVRKK